MNQDPLLSRTGTYECSQYTIQEKDTLFDLLRRFDLSILALKEANPGCDLFTLREGQVLAIGKSADSSAHDKGYVLKYGENLSSVAQKFNRSVLALLKANPHLRPMEIREGIEINLPE